MLSRISAHRRAPELHLISGSPRSEVGSVGELEQHVGVARLVESAIAAEITTAQFATHPVEKIQELPEPRCGCTSRSTHLRPRCDDANDPRQPLNADLLARNQARQSGVVVTKHHLDCRPGNQHAHDRGGAGNERDNGRTLAKLLHQPADRDTWLPGLVQHPREVDRRGNKD